jgi:hypothetical protein
MGAGGNVPEGPKAEGPKVAAPKVEGPNSPILQNIVWFALGMIVTGVVGTVAFNTWLQAQIKDQVQSADTVAFLVAQQGFQAAMANLIKPTNDRITGIKLVAVPRDDLDVPFGCGQTNKAGAASMFVMYGTTEGNSCKVGNINYYKELQLYVPN